MTTFRGLIGTSYAFNPDVYDQDWKWSLLAKLYENNYMNGVDKSKAVLPKKIHQIWLGSPIPEKYKIWGETWKKHNPDWEYRLWTDDDVYDLGLPNLEVYNSITNYGAKSDVLRYHILNKFGGIYIDTDFECLKSFDSLRYLEFFTGVGYPTKPELYVGIIGCIPHHPIMEKVVEEVNKISKDIVAAEILKATSSIFFTNNFFEVVSQYQPGIVAFPPDYFYPFPNSKGHEHKDGKKFIKPISLALHHWEVSWGIERGRTDWVQGEKFIKLAEYTYAMLARHRDDYDQLPRVFQPETFKDINVIYTHTFYVKQLFKILANTKGQHVIITHNSDINIDESFEVPDNVIRWFAQNVNVRHPKIESIPIGLPNNRWSKRFMDSKYLINEQLKRKRKEKRLVYMSHNVATNPKEREFLYPMFEGKPWVTSVKGKNGYKPSEYIDNVYNHPFVICPAGNGLDTHRFWESLYLGSIPIVKRNINVEFYADLPVCIVDDWEQVTEDFLRNELKRIKNLQWNLSKLNFEYWRVRIKKAAVV